MIFNLGASGGRKYFFKDGKKYTNFRTVAAGAGGGVTNTSSIKDDVLIWKLAPTSNSGQGADHYLHIGNVNLTPYKKIIVTTVPCETGYGAFDPQLQIANKDSYTDANNHRIRSVEIKGDTGTYELDVSDLKGIYRIQFHIYYNSTATRTCNISEFYSE